MPITKSAKKALRQNKRRKENNINRKKKSKELIKSAKLLVSQKETKKAEELIPQIYKALDKSVKSGIIKKNTASRRKSRIVKMIAKSNTGNK